MSETGIQRAQRRILSAIAVGRVPHACLISCPDESIAYFFARRAAAQFCLGAPEPDQLDQHPDFHLLEGSPIKVEMIRRLIAELAKRSFCGGGRAVLIRGAHTMNEPAQNALLKTLEEPPKGTLFLLTGNESGLLPTILSRCARVWCGAPAQSELSIALQAEGVSASESELWAAAGGSFDRALRLYREEPYRQLRQKSQTALFDLLSGGVPFDAISTIASVGGAEFILSLLRDILLYRECGVVLENPDQKSRIVAISSRFTGGQINAMIELTVQALARLNTPASAQATFTWLFAEIIEEL